MQGGSWTTAKEYIIRYTITWAHKGYLKPSVINHKDVSNTKMKPCKCNYISSSWMDEFIYKSTCMCIHISV